MGRSPLAVARKGHNMEEFLEILRHDKVRELIEETSRFYYTSPATTVDLGLPIAVTGLFLVVLVGMIQTFTPVMRNLASLPRLLLLPVRKLAGPMRLMVRRPLLMELLNLPMEPQLRPTPRPDMQ